MVTTLFTGHGGDLVILKLRNYGECVQLYKFLEDSNYTGHQYSILKDIVNSPSYFSRFSEDVLELDVERKRYMGFTCPSNVTSADYVSVQDLIQKDGRIIL